MTITHLVATYVSTDNYEIQAQERSGATVVDYFSLGYLSTKDLGTAFSGLKAVGGIGMTLLVSVNSTEFLFQ